MSLEGNGKVLLFILASRGVDGPVFFFSNRADRDDAYCRCQEYGVIAMNALRVEKREFEYERGIVSRECLDATSTVVQREATLLPLLQMLKQAARFLGENPHIIFMSGGGALVPYLAYPSERAAKTAESRCRGMRPNLEARIWPATLADLQGAHLMMGSYGDIFLDRCARFLAA